MTTVPVHEAPTPAIGWPGRLRRIGRSRRLWRASAALTALALATIVFFSAPGSVEVVRSAPALGARSASALPDWARPCVSDHDTSPPNPEVAFCARADGRVIGSVTKSDGETHVLVVGGLHFTLVQLARGAHKPSWGSRIVAVGPLSTSQGLRELKALRLGGA